MEWDTKEIRTPGKNLLVGVVAERNDIICLVIKNRGKEDYIPVDNLITVIAEFMKPPNK